MQITGFIRVVQRTHGKKLGAGRVAGDDVTNPVLVVQDSIHGLVQEGVEA